MIKQASTVKGKLGDNGLESEKFLIKMNHFKPRDVTVCRAANNYIAWQVTLYLWSSFHFCPTKQKCGQIPWLWLHWAECNLVWNHTCDFKIEQLIG